MEQLLRLPRAAPGFALAGAAMLLFSLFLPWYGGSEEVAADGRVSGIALIGDDDAWSFFSVTDVALAILAGVVLGAAALLEHRREAETALAAAAGCALVLVGYRLAEPPELPRGRVTTYGSVSTPAEFLNTRQGVYFALAAVFLIVLAALSARARSVSRS